MERKESGNEPSRRTTIREDEKVSGGDPDHESDEEIMQQMKEAMASEPEGEHAPVTNIGDSICGQRALEQHPSGSSTEAQHGFVAGERVKRLSKRKQLRSWRKLYPRTGSFSNGIRHTKKGE